MLAQRPQHTLDIEYNQPDSDLTSQGSGMASSPDFVEVADRFAKALDTISLSKKAPAEQRADIFKLVETYHQYATNNLQALRKAHNSDSRTALRRLDDSSSQDSMDLDDADSRPSVPEITKEIERWEQEAQVWDMLRRLLPLRYANSNSAKPVRREVSRYQSTAELWDEFIQSDATAQERKAILECLQTSADENRTDIDELVQDYQKQAERGEIIAHGWLHTRSAIKMQKNMHGWTGPLDPKSADAGELRDSSRANPLVTQLDPDVVTRQERKLEPQDQYFERAIWLGCYELLRRGRDLNEIRDWCVERTELWRAVTMSAMPLSKGTESEQAPMDPLSTLLWRRTCFTLARQGGTDDYERAVYGILSGDIPSVEKVCKTWDDFVFAHYNALLRTQFDGYVMKRTSPDLSATVHQTFPAFNALQFHGDASSACERLFGSLETHHQTSAEAKSPMKALQAAIVSNNVLQYVRDLGVALGKRANQKGVSHLVPSIDDPSVSLHDPRFFVTDDHDGLRVATHVYLLVSHLDRLQGEVVVDADRLKAQENLLATYISVLRQSALTELIPLYCSKFDGKRAFYTLSRNFAYRGLSIDRPLMLKIMTKLGMNAVRFVDFQARSFFFPKNMSMSTEKHDEPDLAHNALTVFSSRSATLKYGRPLRPDFLGEEPESLAEVDENLIQSLEWYNLVDGLWDQFFDVGTAIYKRFLLDFNFYAARAMSERVRCADIFRKKAGVAIANDGDLSWWDEARAGKLTSSYKGKPLASKHFVVARNFFEMECLVRALDAMETVASSEALAQDPTEELSREFWSHVGSQVDSIKSFMSPVLSNWLLECTRGPEDYTSLREAYLPETIIGYVSVLHFAGTSISRDNLLECMELASIIAKKDSDIAKLLMKAGRMKEIVEGFANCSKALAISSNEKKSTGVSSKKLREMGWSRDLWAVKKEAGQ